MITATDTPYSIGKVYLIQTVTTYWIGKLKNVYDNEIVLDDAHFVAWMGSFKDCINGKVKSHEKIERSVIIQRKSIVAIIEIDKFPEDFEDDKTRRT